MSSEAKEFPATSYNDWLEKVKKDLRDKSFEDIVWDHSALGAIEPMYANDHSKEAVAIPPRSIQGKGNHWQIRQSFRRICQWFPFPWIERGGMATASFE